MEKKNKININIIVAVDSNNGIGYQNKIPWHIKDDMKYFKKITSTVVNRDKQNIIIMGKNTYNSIKDGPLQNRINIVLTNTNQLSRENLYYTNYNDLEVLLNSKLKNKYEEIFIIGGEQIYNIFMKPNPTYKVNYIYMTRIYNKFECDTFFPNIPNYFKLDFYSDNIEHDTFHYKYLIYKYNNNNNDEYNYISMVKNVIQSGNYNMDRTGEGTKSLFGLNKRYDLSTNFPLLTTKKCIGKELLKNYSGC